MHEVDVDAMMARISARQYKEWEAYERATGPLDSRYERDMASRLDELIQLNNLLTGASLRKKGGKNPAGKFRKPPRPDQLTDPYADSDDEEPDEDEDEDALDPEDEEYESSSKSGDGYNPSKDPFADM